MVILTEVYNTLTGNAGLGIEVSQILNSGLFSSVSCSIMASSLGIQEMDK